MAEGETIDKQTLPSADAAKIKKLEEQLAKIRSHVANATRNLQNTDPYILTNQLREEQKENSKK